MKDRKEIAALQNSRGFSRHQHLRELSMTYEGHNESIAIHPPDISVRGMFINTGTRFAEGSVLKLRFRLARTGVEIATRCEVRYCLPGVGVGVEFLDLSPECAVVIEREIRRAAR